MQAIDKVSVVQQAVEQLKTYISSNDLEVGQKLPTEKELCAQLAIGRCTDEDYKKLEGIHKCFKAAVEANDFDHILLEEGNFHETIIKLSGNELLINIFKLMQQPMMNFRYRSLSLPNAPQDALKPHTQILQAFDLRDPDYGEACMRKHVTLGIKNLNLSKKNYHRDTTPPSTQE